ncbi:MAG: FUSC family protein [Chitinophagales bacterium]
MPLFSPSAAGQSIVHINGFSGGFFSLLTGYCIYKSCYFGAGSMAAIGIAAVYGLLAPTLKQTFVPIPVQAFSLRYIVFESFMLSAALALSLLVALTLGLESPYWVTVSCLAVMKGNNLHHKWQRAFHRVIGTITGLGAARLLLFIENTPLRICLTIPVLQFWAEFFVARNYALAFVFFTPVALLLAEAGSGGTMSADALIITRLTDIAVGSIIGALAGMLLYNKTLRQWAIDKLPEQSNIS